jgi:hypothetical protein
MDRFMRWPARVAANPWCNQVGTANAGRMVSLGVVLKEKAASEVSRPSHRCGRPVAGLPDPVGVEIDMRQCLTWIVPLSACGRSYIIEFGGPWL